MSKDKQTASVLYSYAKNPEEITYKTAYLTSFDVEKLSKSTEAKNENQVIFSWSLDGAKDAIQKPGKFFLVCNEPNSQHYTGYLVKVDKDGKTENITAFNEIEGKNQYGYAKTQLEKIGLTNLPDSTTTTYLTTNAEYPADATGFCGDVVSYMARKFGENGTIPTLNNFKEDYPEIEKISEGFRQKNLEEGSKKITDEEKKSLEIADSGSTSKDANEAAKKEMEEEVEKVNNDLKAISKGLENPDEEKKTTPEDEAKKKLEEDEAKKKLEEDGLKDTIELAKEYEKLKKINLDFDKKQKDLYNGLLKSLKTEDSIEDKKKAIEGFKTENAKFADGKGKDAMNLLLNVVESVISDDKLSEEDKKKFLENFSKQFPEFKTGRIQRNVPKTVGDIASKLDNLVQHYQKEESGEAGKSIVKHIATASSKSDLLKPLNDIVDKINDKVKEGGEKSVKNLAKYGSQGFAVFLIIGTALGAPYMLPLALIGSIAVVKAGEMFGNKAKDENREKTIEKIKQERQEREELEKIRKQKEQKDLEIKRKQEEEAKTKKPLLDEKSKLEGEIKNLESEKAELIKKAGIEKLEGKSQNEEDTKRITAIEDDLKLKTGRIEELDKLIKANPENENGKRKNSEEVKPESDTKKPKLEEEIKVDVNSEKPTEPILEVKKRNLDDREDEPESKKNKTELAESSEEDDSKKVEIDEKSRKDVLAKYGLDDSAKRKIDPNSVKESKFSHGLPGGSREI